MARVIKAQFACETHREFGTIGLRPTAVPNADPLGGIAVAHDMLEHFEGDDGGVEAEFQALGAAYLIRGTTGYFQRNGNVNRPEDHLSSDFVELYRHVVYEGFTLLHPGDVAPVEERNVDQTLQAISRMGVSLVKREEEEEYGEGDSEELAMFCCDQTRERILGWLRTGYRKAVERFSSVDIYALAYTVFENIETRIDKFLKTSAEEGMIVDVEIDLDRLSVSIEAGYGVDETDYCPDCEGKGERNGEDEGNYHDCPRALNDCDPTDPSPDCSECKGKGYVAPPVKCAQCGGTGEISTDYRESI